MSTLTLLIHVRCHRQQYGTCNITRNHFKNTLTTPLSSSHFIGMAVEPQTAETAYQPLSKAIKRAELKHIKEIKEVSPGKVVVINAKGEEETLGADGIIIATGSKQSSPLMKDVTGKSKEERKAQFTAFRDAVKNSKAGVLVVGGGTTGVELAGEIRTDFSDVKCTLVSKSDLLLRGSAKRESMHKLALKQLETMGVNVVTGDYIEDLNEDYVGETKTFTTKKGREIVADVVVVCAGGTPNVPFAVADGTLDVKTKGLVVDGAMLCEKLSSDENKPIWAVGDCTMYGGRGMFIDPQVAALVASVSHFMKTGSTKNTPMKYNHKASESFPSLISVGRHGAAFSLPFANVRLGKMLKCKDLGVAFIYKKAFGIKV